MKGYKAFNKDLKCRDMQYEIGKEYTFDGEPIPCKQGFHFCKSVADCYNCYDMSDDTRICEIIASGDIKMFDGVKYCTNKIKIVREVRNPRAKCNTTASSSGYCNSGCQNSGNFNSGDRNSGKYNSGNRNSGNCNLGDHNSGYRNLGYRNSGDCNSGDRNSGDWNSGNWNSGIFNTNTNPKIKIFDAESDWTITDWHNSRAYIIMSQCPFTYSDFIFSSDMSDEEKENHPEFKTIGGYIKTIFVTNEDRQKWWDTLLSDERQEVYALPNFDANKFKMCTGITVLR